MNRVLFFAPLLLLGAHAVAQPAEPFNSTYDADARMFPDEVCPAWQLYDTAVPEDPSLMPGSLVTETSAGPENAFYVQEEPDLDFPDPLIVEFRARFVSGQSSNFARATISVGANVGPDEGAAFFIGNGEAFLTAGEALRGETAALDTTVFHTYRLEIHGSGLVEVFADDAFMLAGSTYFSSNDFGTTKTIYWGDASSGAMGRADWEFFRHNGHATGCSDVDADGDGVIEEQDCDDLDAWAYPGLREFFDNKDNDCDGLIDEDMDGDQDGIPDSHDACPVTPAGAGVDPEGCQACEVDTDADGDGHPASQDCDDSDASVNPRAIDVPGNRADENCDGVVACDPGADWGSRHMFLRCVLNEVRRLYAANEITRSEAKEIIGNAKLSHVGGKNGGE